MKKIDIALAIVGALLLAWVGISWLEIICHNLDPNPTYAEWNFFTLLVEICTTWRA